MSGQLMGGGEFGGKVTLHIIVESQTSIIVQPVMAEVYEYPCSLICDCQQLAEEKQKPVVLLDKHGHRAEFKPFPK